MKKFLMLCSVLVMALAVALGLSACHLHLFGSWQSDDATTHSRECSCGEKRTEDHTLSIPSAHSGHSDCNLQACDCGYTTGACNYEPGTESTPELKVDWYETAIVADATYEFKGNYEVRIGSTAAAGQVFNGVDDTLAIHHIWFSSSSGTFTTLYIKKLGEAEKADSDFTTVQIGFRPSAPLGFTKTDCTDASNNDGTISGVSVGMEYRVYNSGDEWTTITMGMLDGGKLTDLTPGKYEFRIAAVVGVSFTSVSSDPITVKEYEE